ncbi:MAG: Cerebroside-sulfatase [Planctomycetota bacterium]|nr:MAG: Cerebroside-sulfatase [Planctomycetota bacterium]
MVIILADDMGFGDVHCLNPSSRIPTPNLDALAAAGATMTDAHSPSAVCTPTRYGLLTGRYCWRGSLKRGVLGGYSPPLIEPGRRTVADYLKAHGYRTAAVGKWHLGMDMPMRAEGDKSQWNGDPGVDFSGVIADSPIHHGFDRYFGVSASLDMPPYVFIRNDRFASLPTIQQPAVKFPHFVRAGPRAEDFVIDQVLDRLADEAVQFIQQASAADEPYFLYLPFTAPHKPTQPHERFRGITGLNEYGDFVHQVDWTVGRVLEAIDQSGEADQTLVVFSSDNGSYMFRYDDPDKKDHVDDPSIQGYRATHHRANGPWRGTKADIWEGGHHVPTFVRWPAVVKPGTQCATPVCLVDLFATVADVVGGDLRADEAEDSFSWLPLLRGESTERGAPVIHHSVAGMFAIRDGRWKLICGNGSGGREQPKGQPFAKPYQLFDLQADPAEANDVASEHPEIVERLTDRLESMRSAGRSR